MRLLLITCTTILVTSLAQAITLEGLLLRKGDQFLLKRSQASPIVQLKDTSFFPVLKKLQTGDYLQLYGKWTENHIFQVHEVDFVGLSKLIGQWMSSDWKFIEFHDFFNLGYYQKAKPLAKRNMMYREYRYKMAPLEEGGWRVILTKGQSVRFLHLKFKNYGLQVRWVDPKTAKPSQPIDFFPL